jgi:putative Mg2+ transporter-C (MgtC) family protein
VHRSGALEHPAVLDSIRCNVVAVVSPVESERGAAKSAEPAHHDQQSTWLYDPFAIVIMRSRARAVHPRSTRLNLAGRQRARSTLATMAPKLLPIDAAVANGAALAWMHRYTAEQGGAVSYNVFVSIALPLGAALLAGSLIGIERSFNGRPAGFRTHALVCVASASLMLLTTHQELWLDRISAETVRTDPTRMAQGIMTGIGFLGAGVIFKDGLTVRGLTTAASIWMTAAIGTLVGVGFFVPGALATATTLFTLSAFRLLESKMPTRSFVRGNVRFRRELMLSEEELRQILRRHHFSISTMSYALVGEGNLFEYHLLIRTIDRKHLPQLCDSLLRQREVLEFRLSAVAN